MEGNRIKRTLLFKDLKLKEAAELPGCTGISKPSTFGTKQTDDDCESLGLTIEKTWSGEEWAAILARGAQKKKDKDAAEEIKALKERVSALEAALEKVGTFGKDGILPNGPIVLIDPDNVESIPFDEHTSSREEMARWKGPPESTTFDEHTISREKMARWNGPLLSKETPNVCGWFDVQT